MLLRQPLALLNLRSSVEGQVMKLKAVEPKLFTIKLSGTVNFPYQWPALSYFYWCTVWIYNPQGGLGMPLVVAIIFFLIFHLLNMFGEKFVRESILSPFVGMWLAVIVLTPVGIFLTYKAMHDSRLFNKILLPFF